MCIQRQTVQSTPSTPTSLTELSSRTLRSNIPHMSPRSEKRARAASVVSDTRASSSLSPVPDEFPPPRAKKPKRAETRPCPACSELIPIRLLATHAELEMQRVEDIISHVGDAEVLAEVDDLAEGMASAQKRRSAVKARRSLTALQPSPRIYASSSIAILTNTTTAAIEHTIGYITRRRKARHTRLKEFAKEEATWLERHGVGSDGLERESPGTVCPVCSQPVRGDRDVVEAHVDACLAHESRRAQELEQERTELVRSNEDVDVDVDTGWDEAGHTRVITNASLRGTGIHIRPVTVDIEDDIDIDGTDDAVFGDAQFGEADVQRAVDGDQQPDGGQQTDVGSRNLGEDMDRIDVAVLAARSRGDGHALASALEAKLNAMPAPATCRICLSPYVDPTISTGCWHACCATCWLRCLGTTKMCPMCQRITGASELRRVYL